MKEIKLKQKKQNKISIKKISSLFEDKKKRYLYMTLFILPFVIAIGIFGFVAYKEGKSLYDLLKGNTEVNDDHKIESMNYILRDNATDIQFEYFTELKNAIENPTEEINDKVIAGLVCKNYVVDFYTWTNKQGQYDISAMYYVYTPQKETIFLQARDTFYKYINTYINEYGSSNLLEVESVTVTSTEVEDYEYVSENEEVFEDPILVRCTWTYKENSKFSTVQYPTSSYFLVVKREGRFEIVEASEKKIDARQVEIEEESETESESESESESE